MEFFFLEIKVYASEGVNLFLQTVQTENGKMGSFVVHCSEKVGL